MLLSAQPPTYLATLRRDANQARPQSNQNNINTIDNKQRAMARNQYLCGCVKVLQLVDTIASNGDEFAKNTSTLGIVVQRQQLYKIITRKRHPSNNNSNNKSNNVNKPVATQSR
jgi:hypothetical protein